MKKRHAAFTLIELMVVIAVIALLLSILLPALGMAKDQTRRIVCSSNQKQLFLAAVLYSHDNDGFFPLSRYSRQDQEADIEYCWDFTIDKTAPDVVVGPGLLWQDDMPEKIQQCPAYKKSEDQPEPFTGYNYNTSYVGHGQGETVVQSVRSDSIGRPERCALFGDGQYTDGANKYMRSPLQNPGDQSMFRFAGTQGYRHSRQTNVVWADGHTESLSRLYTNVFPSRWTKHLQEHNDKNPGQQVGFLSEDNSAYDIH